MNHTMNHEELIVHLQGLLQAMQKAEQVYRQALEWDRPSADHISLKYEKVYEPILYKYNVITDWSYDNSIGMSNQILQYVVENWDTIRPKVFEALRKTWQEATDEYLTCLNNLHTALESKALSCPKTVEEPE